MNSFLIHNPKHPLIINHRPMWEQWLISSQWIKGRISLVSLFLATPAPLPAVLTLPILWSDIVGSNRVCVCVCWICAFFCVYVSGSNEAEDEADMKSIRRCQFGLILMLSSTPCITHACTTHRRYEFIKLICTTTHTYSTYTHALIFHKFDMRVIEQANVN